ncbi:MAG: DUF3488 and transglutaminase-like domain-containing protein [Rhodocyclaceae bacterium]
MNVDQRSLPRPLLLQLSAVAALVLLPFALFQPIVVSALSALLVGWRAYTAWRDLAAPPKWLLVPLALAGVGLTWVAFGQLLGKLPGLAILSLLLPLKLLESRDLRDARAALLLACFLMMGLFLHAQTPWVAVCVGLATLVVIASLARIQDETISFRQSARQALSLCGQGVPLMIVLFVLFPRVSGPLWGLPLDAFGGMTGLSDRMAPGTISALIESGDIAFRAEFKGAPPPPSLRYWRGPVLTNFDGREWTQSWQGSSVEPPYEVSGPAYDYVMTIEASNERWLLALDYPAATPEGRISDDFVLIGRQPVRARQRYALQSYPQTPVGVEESARTLGLSLRLPPGRNPRSLALAAQWRALPDPAERLRQALGFMRRQSLQYTLYPPLLGDNSVDEFLFDSRRGFCEHFSSAFVVLMRAAGVPARVVTGYQGGELNPIDGTLVVRQSDAHAWAEVWMPQRGWVRVDPTAATFPQRIDGGIGQTLGAGEPLPFSARQDWPLLRDIRYRWEAMSNTWNQWVLGYNTARQSELLRNIGLPNTDWRMLAALMAFAIAGWMSWLAWRPWPERHRPDALERVWLRLVRRLRHEGLPQHGWEPATRYAQRIARKRPDIAEEIRRIAERYATLRYSAATVSAADLAALRRDIDRLSI